MVKQDEALIQVNQQLQAQTLALATANERLTLELTEQKRTMVALKNSVQSLRNLATISADWYWEQDAEHRFIKFTGEQSAVKLDTERESNIGKRRWELPGAVPLDGSWEAHRAVLDDRQPFRNFEYMRVLGDDLPHYLSVSGVPIFDSQNRFLGYQGTVHDLSAVKRSEEAQRKSSGFLDDIIDNIPTAFHLSSVKDGHRVVRWNKAAEALYGLTREEAVGRTVHDCWPKADADRMHASNLELVAGGVMQDFPDRAALTRHRGPIRVHMRKVPLRDASGAVSHVLITAEDITTRQQAETELRASEARFRTVVAAMAEGVLLRDAEGKIVDCNASAERILGKTLAQMKGFSAFAPEWQTEREDGSPMPEEERPTAIAVRTGLPQSDVVACFRKPDGNVLWGLLNVQPLFDGSSSTPSGFVSTITDISKRKRDEMEIVRLNVDLENRVLRRTAQLETANKELEAFSYSVAHDLRSPLSAIDGYCSLLQKAVSLESGERSQHYLDRIRRGVQRMGKLTDGLLSLAQLSRTSLSWETVDLSAEAAKVIRQCSENDTARVLQATVEPGLLVRADSSLLRQVLQNLIGNAWKFSSKKSHAEISFGQQLDADQQTVYFVRDNGAGFDMAYADKLFGTFERLHSPEEFAGSGIGLATVKRIIVRHGGRIWARSSLGEGSTFYFTLGSDQGSDADASAATLSDTYISSDNDVLSVGDQQFSKAFEHAAIGMTLVGIDTRRLKVNSAFCQMLGYSEAELLARSVREITHPDDIEWDLLQAKRALAGEIETYQVEKRYIHRSGRIVWGYLTSSLVRDADRRPLHFVSQIQDITERKQTEQILRESEERFRALTALTSDWFWEQDENFRFVLVSGAMTDMAGVTADMTIGKTRWELDHVNIEDSVWAAHKAQLERHEVFHDFVIPRFDGAGQLRHLSISGVPIFDLSGCFTGYRGTGRDNTAIYRVTEALRASETQLRQITDTVPALIAYLDKEQRFSFHNLAYEEVFGLSFAQINGQTLAKVLGEAAYAPVKAKVDEVLSGYPVRYERVHTTLEGIRKSFAMQYLPRYGEGDDEGEVLGFFSLGTDITELKRIDRMKTEFVSTVSHELRTPLTSIRGSLGLISGGVAGEIPTAVKNLVGIAKSNCERLIRLINDMLDSEKIDSGKMRLDLQVADLTPLIRQALAANEGFATQHRVKLELHAPPEALKVRIDSDRMTQVLTNLLSNAAKFSPADSTVEVRLSRVPGSVRRVRVEVVDHGPGIPDEFRSRIFQKFSQADSSDTKQKGGSGLGLNISRALIEQMNGAIGFTSEAGVGTTFFFELPECKEAAQPTPSAFSALSAAPQHFQAAAAKLRILVCEGDPDVARLISMMLGKAGFQADMALSAAQAQACLAQSHYDAVTVDLKLPDQSGAAFISALRSADKTRDLPVVVIAAQAEQGRLQFSHKPLSVTDWLAKPIDESLLILSVRRAVAGLHGAKPRILHVEDDPDIQCIAATIVQDYADFEFAATLDEARALLSAQRFDLVLLDLGLGEDSGWDLVGDIDALDPRPPVIVVSASDLDPADGSRAQAVLVKARTSNSELLHAIQRVLQIPGDPGPSRPVTLS